MPGSGKSTLGDAVSQRVNELYVQQQPESTARNDEPVAVAMPMDGFHLSRQQLDAMPDPDSAHARRGAAFTFDGDSFYSLVKKLQEPICPESSTLYAPSFDHALNIKQAHIVGLNWRLYCLANAPLQPRAHVERYSH